MDNLQSIINDWVVGIFSLGMIYYSFTALNQCNKSTKLRIRIPLVVFLSSGVGALILALSPIIIHWSYTLIVIGVTLHLAEDRRLPKRHVHVKLQPQTTN